MKFTIDIEEFWLEEDDGLEEGLKKHITHDVISQIKQSLKGQIEISIRAEVEKQFKENLATEVSLITREAIGSG